MMRRWLVVLSLVFAGGLGFLAEVQAESTETQIEVVVNNPSTPIPSPTPLPSLPQPESEGEEEPSKTEGCSKASPGEAAYINRAVRVSETEVRLEFMPAEKPWTHYVLSYGYVGHPFSFGTTIENPSGSFVVGELGAGKSYRFQILAVNDCAPGLESNILVVTLGGYDDDSLIGRIFESGGLEVGEEVLAPDQVWPIERGASEEGAVTAGEIAWAQGQCEWSWRRVILGLFRPEVCCAYGWWWLLCWPWWLLILILVGGGYWWWRQERREKKRRQRVKQSQQRAKRKKQRGVRRRSY